jgi:hypothetical protein
VPVGGFAKDGIKPLSGFDDVLNRAVLVIRRKLDTVPRGANLNTLSTPPDACRSTEFQLVLHTHDLYQHAASGSLQTGRNI